MSARCTHRWMRDGKYKRCTRCGLILVERSMLEAVEWSRYVLDRLREAVNR